MTSFDNLIEFTAWPKMPRLSKSLMVVTEKIDGTNAAIGIKGPFQFGHHIGGGWGADGLNHDVPENTRLVLGDPLPEDHPRYDGLPDTEYLIYAQSRRRLIIPEDDNYGFAKC
jgi:hypothetical protein